MIIDFRKKKTHDISPLIIGGREVEQVEHFKFLGTVLSATLAWDEHCTAPLWSVKLNSAFTFCVS